MITSAVNHHLEPVVQMPVHDTRGQEHIIEAVIDTGFSGDLSLPTVAVSVLGLPFVNQVVVVLADGSNAYEALHKAVIRWDGVIRIADILASGRNALVGTGLLAGHRFRADFVPGGPIEIERLP